jgi:hypothetical protein
MKHGWAPIAALLAACANTPEQGSLPPVGEYRFLGNGLVCRTENPDDWNACYRIGAFKVGDAYKPSLTLQEDIQLAGGVVASVFPIIKNDQYEAYWVLGHKEGRIVSVQLTGNYPRPELAFSSIMLGDPQEKVQRILGPRYTVNEVKEINGAHWSYRPFAISVEIVGGKVHSIRVADENL